MLMLSCGHSVREIYESYSIAAKDEAYDAYTHSLIPAVKHMEVCRECYDMYIDTDLVLPTREDEENYLLGYV